MHALRTIQAVKHAPDTAVARLFDTHYVALVRLALHLVDDQGSAEDLVQDVFLAMQRRGEPPDDPRRYLQRAVVNRARSMLRRRRVARAFVPQREVHAAAADEQTLRDDRRRIVLAALRKLPTRQREVAVLRFYEDLDNTTIAELLGISPSAVSTALSRALAALTTSIEGTRND